MIKKIMYASYIENLEIIGKNNYETMNTNIVLFILKIFQTYTYILCIYM